MAIWGPLKGYIGPLNNGTLLTGGGGVINCTWGLQDLNWLIFRFSRLLHGTTSWRSPTCWRDAQGRPMLSKRKKTRAWDNKSLFY